MAMNIVTARVEEEGIRKINALVDHGMFPSVSDAIRNLTNIGLIYFDLNGHEYTNTVQMTKEFCEYADDIASKALAHSLLSSVTVALAAAVEMNQERPIIDVLSRIDKTAESLPIAVQEYFYDKLHNLALYRLAQRVIGRE